MNAPPAPPRRRSPSFSDIKPVVLRRSPSVPPLSPTDTVVMAPPPGFSIAGLAAAIGPSAPPALPPQSPALPSPALAPFAPLAPDSEPAPTLVLVRRSPSAPSELEVAPRRGANARTLIGFPAEVANDDPAPVPVPAPAPAPALAPALAPRPARAAIPSYRPWPRWVPLAVFGVFVALSIAELVVAYALRP